MHNATIRQLAQPKTNMPSTPATDAAAAAANSSDSIITKRASASSAAPRQQQPALGHGTCANEALQKPCKNSRGWRKIVRNFTPS